MGKIFICYRRDDSQHQAGRIYDRLVARFGKEGLFWDVDAIPFGVKFPERIRAAIAECDVFLVLIGERWLDMLDAKGNRRLDDAGDYVRLEIEEALRQGVPAIPVLLDGASMPSREQLPPKCGDLAEVNAPRVRAGSDFNYHIGQLLDALSGIIAGRERQREEERAQLAREHAERERIVELARLKAVEAAVDADQSRPPSAAAAQVQIDWKSLKDFWYPKTKATMFVFIGLGSLVMSLELLGLITKDSDFYAPVNTFGLICVVGFCSSAFLMTFLEDKSTRPTSQTKR